MAIGVVLAPNRAGPLTVGICAYLCTGFSRAELAAEELRCVLSVAHLEAQSSSSSHFSRAG
jgi:hypothetical protein